MAMLEVQNLTKTYKGQPSPAIENVSLQINEGEIMAFLGPNGAGKSTALMIRAASRFAAATSKKIR